MSKQLAFFVFKQSRRVGGKPIASTRWSGRVKMPGETRYTHVPLNVTDKRVAEQKLAEYVKERERESVGLTVPRGVRDAFAVLLSEHVTRFLADVAGKGRAPRTITTYNKLLTVLFRGCAWKTLGDVTANSFSDWRARSKHRPKYLNDMHGVVTGLMRWMERQGMLLQNPLRHVQKISNASAPEYRRALTGDQIRRLLAVAPDNRAQVYHVILYTGLRRHELNLLTWADFELESVPPVVVLSARITKNRKAARLELRPEVVEVLRRRRADSMPFEWAFRGKVPSPAKLRVDLAAAEIPAVDEKGRVLDVHALRKTFCTQLRIAGVPIDRAKEMMRHSDMKLTMQVYTDVDQLPLAAELAKLPSYKLPFSDSRLDSLPDSQTGVAGGLITSPAVGEAVELATRQVAAIVPFSPAESSSVATVENLEMVGAARFELATSTSRT